MTYKVVLNGEEIISGKTTLDIVREMMKDGVCASIVQDRERIHEARRQAHPYATPRPRRIRTGQTKDFLADVVAAGLLEKVSR